MAELFTSTVPNLIQGVSQQPDAQRDPTQAELQINAVSSSAEGLRKRDPTQTLARVSSISLGDVFVHAILRDRSERYLAVISSSGVKVFDLDGVAQTVSAPSGYGYLSGVTDAKRQIRCGTVADYTFVASSLQVVAMDSALAPAVARPAANEALVWVKAANYGQSYRVNVNGTLATVTTTTTAGTAISTADIAEQIKTALAGVAGVSIARAGSVLHLTSASTITISATDARANADITAITNSVQAFTALPTIAPTGYQVEVTGDPSNNFDGYYVKFQPRTGAGTFGEGAWEETVAPGTQYKLNPATMPQVLVRLPAGTWHFGPLNGAALTGLTLPTWGQRVAGDSESAPDPSFVGQAVNDIFVHRGRLGILADEKRIFSRAKDFFAFFPETVTTVLDSDPIDKTASSSRVSVLRYAVPFQGEMLLFSDDYQFRSYATDASLTPTTDAITILTGYEIDPAVRPIQMGGSVVFCQANGEWSQLRQFSVRGAGTALVGDAESITDHVSSYIPSGIFQLAANDTGNSLYCISSKSGYANRIYTYKYFYRNGGSGIERAQSSWSYWDLPGAESILSIVAIQEALYLLVQRGGEVFLEKMPVLDRQSVAAAPYPLLLDRWVSTTTASPAAMRVPAGVYDSVTKQTTWTLPFTIRATTQAWSAYQTGYQGGVLLGAASSGNTIAARGDWSTAQVYVGETYGFRYRPSRFKAMRTQGGGQVASNTLRAQIRQARLRYHETGYFQVRVKPTGNRDESVYAFPGSTVGLLQGADQGQAGVFPIPMFGRGESITVTIENDTAHPCKFASLEWTGLITGKGRAVQQ
jgi:metal-sulfur cluster biosynthetic enzyme